MAPSAGKHGVSHEDLLTVLSAPLHRVDGFDAGLAPGTRTTLFIGLSTGGQMLEVLTVITPPTDVLVFHAMPLRPEIAEQAGFYEEDEED